MSHITPREKQILLFALEGLTSKQTARKLNISHRTVEKHLANAKLKLNCKRKSEVVYKLFYNITSTEALLNETQPQKLFLPAHF